MDGCSSVTVDIISQCSTQIVHMTAMLVSHKMTRKRKRTIKGADREADDGFFGPVENDELNQVCNGGNQYQARAGECAPQQLFNPTGDIGIAKMNVDASPPRLETATADCIRKPAGRPSRARNVIHSYNRSQEVDESERQKDVDHNVEDKEGDEDHGAKANVTEFVCRVHSGNDIHKTGDRNRSESDNDQDGRSDP
jgi:hypothetical protein